MPEPSDLSLTAERPAARHPAARHPAAPHPGAWRTVVPTAFVLLVLAALVLLPFANAAYLEPAREQIRLVADPARGEVTDIHVALAREVALVDDYIDTGNPALARRYHETAALEEDATRRLGTLAAGLGDTVRARYAELRRLQAAWHAAAEAGLAAAPDARGPDALRGDDFEALLLGAARLDEAIGQEIRRDRDRILSADRAARLTTALLAFAGLTGAGAVALLARRLHRNAAELEERRAELERVVEGRARLVRGISHDVKNPLHAIDGHATLLEEGLLGPLTETQADSVARIRRGVRSVLALVEDLLALSRAEAGRLRVEPRPTDLAALLHETVEVHRGAARAAGHELTLSIADGPAVATVATDPERVRQVLGNLLSNAVKYTPRGGRVEVRAERRARARDGAARRRAGPWVAIDVVDTGPGVPPDQRDAIFDEFARLPAHAGVPGSGLGLAIARRVARLLGGDLTAGDGPGGGARFTLWLPAD